MKKLLALVLCATMTLSLAGCGEKATEDVAVTTTTEETTVEETAEQPEEEVEEEPVEEVMAEEPEVVEEPDLYIPEGIDMDSTLSGEEWVATFVGKVSEPVVVVFNDNTGRKEVVQANSKVTINPDEDRIAIYWNKIGMGCTTRDVLPKEVITSEQYEIRILDSEKYRSIPVDPIAMVKVTDGETEWILEFTIIVE